MVVVVFAADGRSMAMPQGRSVCHLKPTGVEIYDADGKLLYQSNLEVRSVTVSVQPIDPWSPPHQ